MTTKIEWADLTINPVVGCSKCSPGCENCYAERFAARLAKNPATAAKYAGVVDDSGKWTGKISHLDLSCFDKLPKKPKRVFVGSMTDLFFNTDKRDILHIFLKMNRRPQHRFMVLTKRPEAMRDFVLSTGDYIPPNIWLGVTVCNQAEADEKIPVLLETPAAKRFVSVEPMLGPVDLREWLWEPTGKFRTHHGKRQLELVKASGLDWVICGAETGHKARTMQLDWARSLRDQCQEADMPFFFKKDSSGSGLLDGVEYHEFPTEICP